MSAISVTKCKNLKVPPSTKVLTSMLRQTQLFISLIISVKGWSPATNQSTVQKHDVLFTQNCLYESIKADFYIMNAENPLEDGLVKLKLSFRPELFTICYPATPSYDSNRQVAILAHLACRQLGYMTYEHSTVRKHTFPTGMELYSVRGDMLCKGNEQSLDYCAWCNATVDRCSDVLSTQCSSCHYVLKAPEGYITNPGHPYAYLHTVQCEWEIIVPEGDNILLTFRQFMLPRNRSNICLYGQAHVEIIYGYPGTLSVHRFCSVNYGETIKVPHRKVQVRFQSGIYSGSVDFSGANYGFNILFKGEPAEPSTFHSFKILVIAVILVIVFVMSVLYCWCRKCRPRRKNLSSSQAASEIQNALRIAPQRKVSFYVRPDTEQSKTDRTVLFMPPQTERATSPNNRQKTQVYDSSESSYPNIELIGMRGAELATYHPTATTSYQTPHIPRKEILNPGDRNNRMAKLKATLFSRFSSSAYSSIRSLAKNGIAPVVKPQVTNICNSFESTSTEPQAPSRDSTRNLPVIKTSCAVTPDRDAPSQQCIPHKTTTKPKVIPTIVVECVDDQSEL